MDVSHLIELNGSAEIEPFGPGDTVKVSAKVVDSPYLVPFDGSFRVRDADTDTPKDAPSKKERVLARIRELRGGKLYDATFGARMRGEGIFAEQTKQLFEVSARRAGLNRTEVKLSTAHFRRPSGVQLDMNLL